MTKKDLLNLTAATLLCCCGVFGSPRVFAQNSGTSKVESTPVDRKEGTDASGVHYLRLSVLPESGTTAAQSPGPRFTVECDEVRNKHTMQWFVSFGGVPDPGFRLPPRAGQSEQFNLHYPAVNLKMDFEGYMTSRPFTRSWMRLPSGEFRYRNAGLQSPNMDSPRYFLGFLYPLPGLRIGYAKPAAGSPQEVFFPAQSLMDEIRRSATCIP